MLVRARLNIKRHDVRFAGFFVRNYFATSSDSVSLSQFGGGVHARCGGFFS